MNELTMNIRSRFLAVALVIALLSGCSVYSPSGTRQDQGAPVDSVESEGATPDPGAEQPPEISSPESRFPAGTPDSGSGDNSLINRAEAAIAAGDFEQALTLLERAQRIDPTNADIYLALARTYTAKGDVSLAISTAERGLLYCRNDRQCSQLRAFTY